VVSYSAPIVERGNVLEELSLNIAPVLGVTAKFWHCTGKYKELLWQKNGFLHPGADNLFSESISMIDRALASLVQFCELERGGLYVIENLQTLLTERISVNDRELIKINLVSALESASRQNQCLPENRKYLVLLDTNEDSLPSLFGAMIPDFNHPLPTTTEIASLLSSSLDPKLVNEELLGACAGLTKNEIGYGLNFSATKDASESLVHIMLDYKVSRLKSLGLDILPSPKFTELGGMERFKEGLKQVKSGFSDIARILYSPLPKGWLLVGPPGTGKSYAAQVAASYLGFPLISLSVDRAIASGPVGLRRLLDRIEACRRGLVFIDEFDKFFLTSGTEDAVTKQILGLLV